MPSVIARAGEEFDNMLRRFKRSCEKAGIVSEMRRREYYRKPTETRKLNKLAAVKREIKKRMRDGMGIDKRKY